MRSKPWGPTMGVEMEYGPGLNIFHVDSNYVPPRRALRPTVGQSKKDALNKKNGFEAHWRCMQGGQAGTGWDRDLGVMCHLDSHLRWGVRRHIFCLVSPKNLRQNVSVKAAIASSTLWHPCLLDAEVRITFRQLKQLGIADALSCEERTTRKDFPWCYQETGSHQHHSPCASNTVEFNPYPEMPQSVAAVI